jgi:hypothetical protein
MTRGQESRGTRTDIAAPANGPHHREPGLNSVGAIEPEEIMPLLTPEQREAIEQAISREGYARIEDYVLLKAEDYDRLRTTLDHGPDMAQVGSLVAAAMEEEDAGDPLLESYQRYRI